MSTSAASPSLYATPDELTAIRRRLSEHDWYARSFANLRAPADELLRRGFDIPREKGFVFYETCPADNTPLRQDPFNPRDHPCPTCGRNYTDEPYHRAWVTFFQTYLSQRAVEMGIAYGLTGDSAYAAAIRHVLLDYARHYEEYPLVDCVLGPTRLFQSTYIESLWLASLAAAADFARDAIPAADWRLIRDRLFLPAARVIYDYDEGDNNRQAMNNVALGFVGLLCEESSLVEYALRGPHGWLHHVEHSVLEDGMWYEGDNYHFATLPALLNLAEAMTRNGLDLYGIEVGGRGLKMMFDAPLLDLYPDLTFPARKDSRYASPLGQRWYAGMYELAYRRYGDPAYARLLRTLYDSPPAAEACIANAAGLIDVLPSQPANRERLDWRGVLNAMPDLGHETGIPVTASADMAGTGLGILRADGGRTYASIDYGHYGGGHGHPDRLQLNFYARGRRWLTDFGTGNYFFDHLRWYRSTIGHNTVVVDGNTQQAVAGHLRRFGANSEHGLVAAEVHGAYRGVRCRRTAILLSPDLLLDLFAVEADRERTLDWTLHPCADRDVEFAGEIGSFAPSAIVGDHYEWLQDVRHASAAGDWRAVFRQADDALAVHLLGGPGTEVFSAGAYGPPQEIPNLFPVLIARRRAARTTFAALVEHRAGTRPLVETFRLVGDGRYVVELRAGGRIECRYDDADAVARIERFRPGEVRQSAELGPCHSRPGVPGRGRTRRSAPTDAAQSIDLRQMDRADRAETRYVGADLRVRPVANKPRSDSATSPSSKLAHLSRTYALNQADQVCRGERPWGGPTDLSARFRLDRDGDVLTLRVAVTDDAVVCGGPVERHYDYDGVQVYFDPRDEADRDNAHLSGVYGLVLVPASADGEPARIFPIGPARSGTDPAAGDAAALDGVRLDSSRTADGYELTLRLPLAQLGRVPALGETLGFDLLVNDNDGTFRRAQQMIWTGALGARIWLRRDYHSPARYGALVF